MSHRPSKGEALPRNRYRWGEGNSGSAALYASMESMEMLSMVMQLVLTRSCLVA